MASWDAARWRAVSDAIDRILDLPPPERGAVLEALRARDAGLAADVERLLAEQPAMEAGRFLEGGAAAAFPTATSEAGLGVPRVALTLPPGATFGGYRVHRLLGRGGMGIVYEAEELESGRRVALKILQQRFDDARERERFLREGQLAASIDHEHCVFVFGASEVDGTPSIAMELMQGTLADRLAAQGPLAPAAAVDAALQLVAGLQAAQAAGILHRDVKPSNCFVDAHDFVKIGDFGISRSTRPAQETTRATRGLIAATPAYASPEQLRGAVLDVRSDIYSLGATLYELLTGERPFTAPDLMSLLMTVANDPPRPPHVVAPAVPKGLSPVVLRCLAKRPEDRFQTYEALTAALESYASWSPTPATFGRRFMAGLIDHLAIGLATFTAWLAVIGWTYAVQKSAYSALDPRLMIAQMVVALSIAILYYGIFESLWGAAVGKAVMGLTLVDTAGRPPRTGAVFVRAVVFVFPRVAIWLAWIPLAHQIEELTRARPSTTSYSALAVQGLVWSMLFWTCRRRNGYAGLHDLASGTRVVERTARAVHGTRLPARPSGSTPPAGGRRHVAAAAEAFVVVPGSIEGRAGWRPAYDTRLGRDVWIRELAIGTAPIAPQRASLGRPTRVRWLAGRRTEWEAWDVYEAVEGVPLARALDAAPAWAETRRWLADLAHELAAQRAGDRPPLDLDRVWILKSGRAKLVDDPTEDTQRDDDVGAPPFLADVMQRVRDRAPAPWPMSAECLLRDLPQTLSSAAARLVALQERHPAMTRGRRLVTLGPVAGLAIFMTTTAILSQVSLHYQRRNTPADVRVVVAALSTLRMDDLAKGWGRPVGHRQRLSADEREALEIFLATRHRIVLADERLSDPRRLPAGRYEFKGIADAVLRRPLTAAVDGNTAAANPRVQRVVRSALEDAGLDVVAGLASILFLTLGISAIIAVILAAAFRGVVLRLLGFEIVSGPASPASRLRVTARAVVAWSPLLLPFSFALALGGAPLQLFPWSVVTVGSLILFIAGAGYALANPTRGIQDRVAGTWIVPR